MLTKVRIPRAARDERGLTLVELLVAILTSIVVVGALFAILEVSLHQSTRISDFSQADELGRTAMTKVVDELHSTCLAREFAPVQPKSTASELRFISAHTTAAIIPGAEEHRIAWSKPAETLTDFVYPSNGGEAPKFTFASSPSPVGGTLIASNIAQSTGSAIFRYYKYATSATSGPEAALSSLTPVVPPEPEGLTGAEAKTVASVVVSYSAGPADGNRAADRAADFSGQATFAFSTPAAEATIQDGPCQ